MENQSVYVNLSELTLPRNGSVGARTNASNVAERVTLENSELALQVAYYVIGSFGLLGNSLVLYVIAKSQDMRKKVTNWYIFNQSLADFLGAFFMILTTAVEESNRRLSGLAAEFYCRFWLSKWLLWAMFMASTWNLVAISIERYIAVVFAIWHKTSFTRTKALVSIVSVWLASLAHMSSYLMIPAKVDGGLCYLFVDYVSSEAQQAAAIVNLVLLYILPIVILVYCYSTMARVLHSRIRPAVTAVPRAPHVIQYVAPSSSKKPAKQATSSAMEDGDKQQQQPQQQTRKSSDNTISTAGTQVVSIGYLPTDASGDNSNQPHGSQKDTITGPSLQATSTNPPQPPHIMTRAMRNVIKTLAIVSLCFILCWSSNQIYYLMFNFGYPANFNGAFYHFSVAALFCNCCINPIIYIAQYEHFQRNLARHVPWFPQWRFRRNAVHSMQSSPPTRA